MANRRIVAIIAGILIMIAGASAGVVVAVFGLPYGPLDYKAFDDAYTAPNRPFFHLAIDADATDGSAPCAPINTARFVLPGQTYQVAVCYMNPPEAPQAFQARVLYDGDLNTAPEVADVQPALDDNPDANAGTTTWPNASGQTLGGGWDCSSLGFSFPQGDDATTPAENDAIILCTSTTGPYDMISSGALALITFEATGLGTESLSFDTDTVVRGYPSILDIASCGDIPSVTVPCYGATIWKVETLPTSCDILFEDDLGHGTSLCIADDSWQFEGPGFAAAGVDVLHIGNFVLVLDMPDNMFVLGFGNGPNGPGRALAIDFGVSPLRVMMLEDLTP